MERISKKRRAKAEKPQFPKLRSKYGVNHSFTFSLRAWFNFKFYAAVILLLVALAVVTFAVLEPADFSGDKFTDAFYNYDENFDRTQKTDAGANAATSQSPVRMVGGDDIVLLASEHAHIWSEPKEEVVVPGDCYTAKVVKITKTCECGEKDVTFETRGAVHGNSEITREDGAAATCDKEGYYYDVYTCVGCEKVTAKVQQTIAPLGHHAAEEPVEINRVDPTCTTPGYKTLNYHCEDCDAIVETVTVTLGAAHTLVTETIKPDETKPTCILPGEGRIEVKCSKCDYVESSIPFVLAPLGHNPVETIPAVPPTCENVGYTAETTCDRDGCGFIAEREEIPAKGHNYPLCTDSQCTECEKDRAPGAHNYAKFVIDSKAATCTEAGYEVYYEQKCTSCGHIENEQEMRTEFEAFGHSGKATCLNGFTCTNEGCTYTENKLGHHDKNGDWYCDRCKHHLRDFNTAAFIYTFFLVLTIAAVALFLVLTIKLILTAFKVSSMRLDFYDEVVVWRWGRIFKRHIEQRFIGVYDVLVMPRNKLYYKDSLEKKKPAKYGTVLAKVPGGGYEWNRKFFGVKEYIPLKNYLESKKITERFERPRSNFHDDSI